MLTWRHVCAPSQKHSQPGDTSMEREGGVDMIKMRARPESSDPKAAATGEVRL